MKPRKPRDKSIGHERKWHPRYCPYVVCKLLDTYDKTRDVQTVDQLARKLGVYDPINENLTVKEFEA